MRLPSMSLLDRESSCSCVTPLWVSCRLATRLSSYLFLIFQPCCYYPGTLPLPLITCMVFLPVHTPQACDMILHQSLALTIQLSVPWHTHPLHDSVPSSMSHLGSCMQIPLIIHYIVVFHGHDNIMPTCYNTARSAAPAAFPYPPKPPPGPARRPSNWHLAAQQPSCCPAHL